jgi:hypothetical protein
MFRFFSKPRENSTSVTSQSKTTLFEYEDFRHALNKVDHIIQKNLNKRRQVHIICNDTSTVRQLYFDTIKFCEKPKRDQCLIEFGRYCSRTQDVHLLMIPNLLQSDEAALRQVKRLESQGVEVIVFCPRSEIEGEKGLSQWHRHFVQTYHKKMILDGLVSA